VAGINFPQIKFPDTRIHFTIPGLIVAIITPQLIPIFDAIPFPQFPQMLPVVITLVSYVITGQRIRHHHSHDSHTHKSKGACFFGTYGTTILVQLLIQLNIINSTFLNQF